MTQLVVYRGSPQWKQVDDEWSILLSTAHSDLALHSGMPLYGDMLRAGAGDGPGDFPGDFPDIRVSSLVPRLSARTQTTRTSALLEHLHDILLCRLTLGIRQKVSSRQLHDVACFRGVCGTWCTWLGVVYIAATCGV